MSADQRNFYTACFWGDIATIEKLSHNNDMITKWAFLGLLLAVKGNQTDVFQYLHQKGANIILLKGEMPYDIGRNNNLALAQYMLAHVRAKKSTAFRILEGAATVGSMEILDSIQKTCDLDFTKPEYDRLPVIAAERGFLSFIQCFEKLGGIIPINEVAIAAAKNGYLDIIEYIFNNPENHKYLNPYGTYFQGGTRNVIAAAAEYSQNHVVIFFNEKWPKDVKQYFDEQAADEYFSRAFDLAYKKSNLPLLRFLYEETAMDTAAQTYSAMNHVSTSKDIALTRYLMLHQWQDTLEEVLHLGRWGQDDLIKVLTLPLFVQNRARLEAVMRALNENPNFNNLQRLQDHILRMKRMALLYTPPRKAMPA